MGYVKEVQLPPSCTEANICAGLEGVDEDVIVNIPSKGFIKPPALALLAAWSLARKEMGFSVTIVADDGLSRYLSRMGMGDIAKISSARFRAHPSAGRFIPIHLIGPKEDHISVKHAVDAMCDLVVRNCDASETFLPAFEWAIQEIVDNAVTHADAEHSSVVCGQVYPANAEVHFSICDTGIGVKSSLSSAHQCKNDGEAILLATERGVTRDPNLGQGNGLAGALLISRLSGGHLSIRSGAAHVFFNTYSTTTPVNQLPGTSVSMVIRTDKPVRLDTTWIEHPEGANYLHAERERVAASGFIVRDECAHFGGRPPGEKLRRKVAVVIDDEVYDGTPIRLDFTGVENASSSFLDEVVGKLVQQFGILNFKKRVQLTSASRETFSRLSVVVAQRMKPSNSST